MKWFKHSSGSLKDNLIFEAVMNFGGDGYMVFFGILEVMADELDVDNPAVCRIPIKKLTGLMQISRQKLTKILSFFDEKAKIMLSKDMSFFVTFEKNHVIINCNKFASLCDEYTQRELNKKSGHSPDSSRDTKPTSYIKKKNKEEDINKANQYQDCEADQQEVVDNSTQDSPPDKKPFSLQMPFLKKQDQEKKESSGNGQDKEKFMADLKAAIDKLRDHYNGNQYLLRQCILFVENNLRTKNPRAILRSLSQLSLAQDKNEIIEAPKKYLDAILRTEEGKYNAEDHTTQAESLKAKPGDLENLFAIMKQKGFETHDQT